MSEPTIDRQLREALARTQPPNDIAAKVMAAVERRPRPSNKNWVWYSLLAASIVVVFLFTGVDNKQRERQKRIRAEQTKQQVVYALTLTMEKLNRINGRLQSSASEVRVSTEQKKDGGSSE